MFNYFNYFDKGFIFGTPINKYNPYINYSWSQTLTVDSNQQIKDTGTAGLNLQQFFGQGCWFNGIDMQNTIPVNATIQTEIKRVNGVTEINTNTQVLTNYNVYSGSGAKVYKDLYMFDRVLTTAEIEKYNKQPNQFFMDSLEDSSCVLAMPMCEKDGFVRNYKSYSEGGNFNDVTLVHQTTGTGNQITQNNNVFSITNVIPTTQTYHPLIKFYPKIYDSNLYYVEIEVNCITGTLKVGSIESIYAANLNTVLTTGQSIVYKGIHMFADLGGKRGAFYLDGLNYPTFTAEVTLKNIRKLTGIYPITNYLTTCRTNAQRLPYGLQTSGFKRDDLGKILSKSNFLEADGVGYGNTGWILDTANDFSIECVFNRPSNTLTSVIFGTGIGLASDIRFRASSAIFGFFFGSPVKDISTTSAIGSHLVTVLYKADTKTYSMFINGVFIGGQSGSEIVNSNFSVGLLSNTRGTLTPSVNSTNARLFKVHTKALTQEEVTKNFNKYQSQGLLNE